MLSRLTESGILARLGLARGNRNLRHFWTEVAGSRIHTTVCFGRASSHQLSSATPSQSVAVQALPTNNSTIQSGKGGIRNSARIGDVSGTSSGYERSPTFKRQSKTSPYGFYTGKKTNPVRGLGEGIILQMTDNLGGKGIQFYFDNFFNSPLLRTEMLEKQQMLELFVRNSDKEMSRGDSDFASTDKGVSCVKWMDNRSVLIISNFISPLGKVCCLAGNIILNSYTKMSSRGALMLTKQKNHTVVPSIKKCPLNNVSSKVEKENKYSSPKAVTSEALEFLNGNEISEPESTLRFVVPFNYEEKPLSITVPQEEKRDEDTVPLRYPNELTGPDNSLEVLEPVNFEELLLPQDQVTSSYWVPSSEERARYLECAPKMSTLEAVVPVNVNDLPDPENRLILLVPLNYEDKFSNTSSPQVEKRDVVPLYIDNLPDPENTQEIVVPENVEGANQIEILNTIIELTPNSDPQEQKGKNLDGVIKRGTKRLRKEKSMTPSVKAQTKVKKFKDNHPLRNPCGINCRYKCSTRFAEQWRQQCNTEFWNKNFSERRDFIALCATKLPVKRRRGDSEIRNNSFRYFFNDTEGERVRVCKWFFLTTLGFAKENNSVIYGTLTSIDKNTMTGMASHSTDKEGSILILKKLTEILSNNILRVTIPVSLTIEGSMLQIGGISQTT
ncbi:hypothetical protein J6590_020899 [Homalodisca vitripennis]|nr:hypothetical protein J6590_020899 [Homalodisca vitripennis]